MRHGRTQRSSPSAALTARHRPALHDAHNLAAELAVDDRPPRDRGELMGFLDHGELAAR